jgi:hypothetical protein
VRDGVRLITRRSAPALVLACGERDALRMSETAFLRPQPCARKNVPILSWNQIAMIVPRLTHTDLPAQSGGDAARNSPDQRWFALVAPFAKFILAFLLVLTAAPLVAQAQSVAITSTQTQFTGPNQNIDFTYTCTAGPNGASSWVLISTSSPPSSINCPASSPLAANGAATCTGSRISSASDVSQQDVYETANCKTVDAVTGRSITVSNFLNIPYYLAFQTLTLPNGTQTVSYSQTITAAGGSTPYTFTVALVGRPG